MRLPGWNLPNTAYVFDRVLNTSNRVRRATNDLEEESVKFLEATYFLSRDWFGFDITKSDLKAQITQPTVRTPQYHKDRHT